MLRVGVAPCESESVWNTRTKWAADVLARQGKIELVALPNQLNIREGHLSGERPFVETVRNLPDMDLLVFTRVLSERLVSLISYVRTQGVKVIVDIDDDFRHLPPTMLDSKKIHPTLNPRYNWRHHVRAAAVADWVTCSTPALLKYRANNISVVPNCIPAWYLNIEQPHNDRPLVGWSGAVSAHPGDLESTHGGVAEILERASLGFRVVGSPAGVRKALGLRHDPEASGLVTHARYPVELARLDIGIVPLADSAYTRAKSHITPLSMLAVGAWCIASRSPEYERLYDTLSEAMESPLDLPMALVSPRAREWRRELLRASDTSSEERQARAQMLRPIIAERYTVEARADEWLKVWDHVVHG